MMYVITGAPRTGTSMMARAITLSSALPSLYDRALDDACNENARPGYEPNPNGYYLTNPETPDLWQHDGHLVKLPPYTVYHTMPRALPCKVLLMKRNRAEVEQSLAQAFAHEISSNIIDIAERLERELRYLGDGADGGNLIILDYAEVIQNPEETFGRLKAGGWPIDVDRAITFVDPTLYRIRL